jgi:hypothetical protein
LQKATSFSSHVSTFAAKKFFIIKFTKMTKFRLNTKHVKTFLVSLAVLGLSMNSATAQEVYVGGKENNKATVWKDEYPTTLSTGNACIYSVVADNDFVYAAGYEVDAGKLMAKLWRNGNLLYQFNGDAMIAHAYSIAIAGNNVYVAGYASNSTGGSYRGKVWKDGIEEPNYSDAQLLYSVFVSDGIVYATGMTLEDKVAVWKNGNLLYTLTSNSNTTVAYGSVVVVGSDVYTAGYDKVGDNFIARVWKNNNVHYTLGSGHPSYPIGLYAIDGDLYVAGNEIISGISVAKLWKNGGAGTALTDGTEHSFAHSVVISGNDIYVAGSEFPHKVLFWKNGELTTLATESSGAYSVFVKPAPVAPPTITTESLPNGAVATGYIATLTAESEAPVTWSIASGNLPTGLSLNSATGEIYGTPTTEDIYNFTVKATSIGGSDSKDLSITITPTAVAPAITTTILPDGKINTEYSAQLEATGTASITWSLESGNLPVGLELSETGIISGTPTTAGEFCFIVKVTNSVGFDTKELCIKIDGVGIVQTRLIASVQVFPNPTRGELTIVNPTSDNPISDIEIFDVMGRPVGANLYGRPKIGQSDIGKSDIGQSDIDISHLSIGVYFIRIQTEKEMITRKVIKQ